MLILLDELFGVLLRSAIMATFGYLVGHHVLSPEDGDRFATEFGKHVAIIAGALGTVAWGLWVRYRGRLKFLAALQLPEGATEAEAKATAKSSGTDLLKEQK